MSPLPSLLSLLLLVTPLTTATPLPLSLSPRQQPTYPPGTCWFHATLSGGVNSDLMGLSVYLFSNTNAQIGHGENESMLPGDELFVAGGFAQGNTVNFLYPADAVIGQKTQTYWPLTMSSAYESQTWYPNGENCKVGGFDKQPLVSSQNFECTFLC